MWCCITVKAELQFVRHNNLNSKIFLASSSSLITIQKERWEFCQLLHVLNWTIVRILFPFTGTAVQTIQWKCNMLKLENNICKSICLKPEYGCFQTNPSVRVILSYEACFLSIDMIHFNPTIEDCQNTNPHPWGKRPFRFSIHGGLSFRELTLSSFYKAASLHADK